MSFSNNEVTRVSDFLQNYMKENTIVSMTADECADLLARNNILSNTVGPASGFNFRQMLRDGRDGKILLVKGAIQEKPKARWTIKNIYD